MGAIKRQKKIGRKQQDASYMCRCHFAHEDNQLKNQWALYAARAAEQVLDASEEAWATAMTGSGSSTNKTRKKSMLKAHCPCGSKTSIKNVPSFLTHLAATPCDCGTGSAHRSSTWWKRHPRAVLQAEAMGCTLLHDKVTFEAMGKEDRDTRDQTGSCKLLARHLHMRCKTCEEDEWNISVSRLMAARAGTRTQTRLKCRCNPGYVGEQFTLTVPSRNGILAARYRWVR